MTSEQFIEIRRLIENEFSRAVTKHPKMNYWVAVSYQCVDDKHRQKAEKRHYKWLELAAQFKEAK